ncbi:DUF952 domain-containing protein [Kordiimonas sp. SCSIO 12610]|uniref:DUF952 domain-containing protein n=1 Tax=Kordiimonas sp. SCSIO 12610 TaxID=2829597 RepID=UPI00210B2036|nr:DUF952 domain-containing protein [Kordiimonas sp. SCSIO 12610]UTW55508.1 DUF952 domain-containing protein [Kordiimonas sp. SCSIO 12610]
MEDKIYKILREDEWTGALQSGTLVGAPVDIEDGFIHFSTKKQVQETANKHFAGEYNLYLLEVDVSDLPDETLKWEKSRNDDLFPHLYASLKIEMVSQVWSLQTTESGLHDFSFLENDSPTTLII